jgi:FG-GAP-like repeat
MQVIFRKLIVAIGVVAFALALGAAHGGVPVRDADWTSANHFRVPLSVEVGDRPRSHSPAAVEVDFQALLGDGKAFDESTIEVVAIDADGKPKVFDASLSAGERVRVPHRLDRLYGSTKATLNFVVPDQSATQYLVYFDTVESGLGKPDRYAGLVGDGDCFRECRQQREIGACHFDQFVDFDGDGDLDLFKGGVEPFVYCYENVGGNRLVDRGRLSSGGEVLTLPKSSDNRSWVTVAFGDVDGDGDQDFLPSFNDGPDAGTIVLYRNTTRENHGQLTFTRVGPVQTVSGALLAGGKQAGGWFSSTLVTDWDGDGRLDLVVGSNGHCYLYRSLGLDKTRLPRLADAVPIEAAGQEITLVNPRFDYADADGDGDLDLFAGTQPGAIHWFRNVGSRSKPVFAKGTIVAYRGKYMIGDAHSGVKVADFTGDKLPDLVCGRFWERADLDHIERPRDYGGLYTNVGTLAEPRFERQPETGTLAAGSPYTEQFQICDAVRQNCVRAVDWDRDGKQDLLAGDTDGFIWLFRNESGKHYSVFAPGEKLLAGGKPLSLTASGGHARMSICDWNNDGKPDLIAADGGGKVTLFLDAGNGSTPSLSAGVQVLADGRPIQGKARASVLVYDWNNDGKKDLVFADSDGFWIYKNVGTDAAPLLAAVEPMAFGGRSSRKYVRPNLGSVVDWDGDGKQDFIGCNFENNIRFYKNLGSGGRGEEPRFKSLDGVIIVKSSSPQMISGADAVDWNGDGDIDILTGQGHGGSGLRFFERDWIEDELHGAHPRVTAGGIESKTSGATSAR